MRFYVSGFNIDEAFVRGLVIHKARNAGDFTINFMDAAFNTATFSGEIFIEFQETIRVCTLISQLEAHGACQVTVVTFKIGDANESASNALLRVWMSAEKTGCRFQRGTVSKELLEKTQAKHATEKQKQVENAKDEAKIQVAIQMSLDGMGDKVNDIGGKVEDIQQGVCGIIPDYQKLLREMTEKLAHKTKEVDRIEQKMGKMTHEINKLTAENESLRESYNVKSRKYEADIESLKESCNVMARKYERDIAEINMALATKENQLKDKNELLDVYRVLDNVNHLMELDRSAKQARRST